MCWIHFVEFSLIYKFLKYLIFLFLQFTFYIIWNVLHYKQIYQTVGLLSKNWVLSQFKLQT